MEFSISVPFKKLTTQHQDWLPLIHTKKDMKSSQDGNISSTSCWKYDTFNAEET